MTCITISGKIQFSTPRWSLLSCSYSSINITYPKYPSFYLIWWCPNPNIPFLSFQPLPIHFPHHPVCTVFTPPSHNISPPSQSTSTSLPGIVEQIIMSSSDRSPVRRIGINNSPISSSITYLSGTSMKTVDSVYRQMRIKMQMKIQSWSVRMSFYKRGTYVNITWDESFWSLTIKILSYLLIYV